MFLTPLLDIKSTFEELYNQLPNYKKSHFWLCMLPLALTLHSKQTSS